MRSLVAPLALLLCLSAAGWAGERTKHFITSTLDGTQQPCYAIVPATYDASAPRAPLLVMLHSWSGDVEQRSRPFEEAADKRGWLYLHPNFRGANDDPDACGSAKAQQDILDAVAWACAKYPVDGRRIYLVGVSGGGHMTLLMAGRHPRTWAAASAWVGISDLAAWHARHAGDNYGAMLRKCCGGAPGESAAVDREYRERSPLTHLAGAAQAGLPLDIAAGVHDGHQGSVPVRQSLEAFNALAVASGAEPIAEAEITQISRPNGRLEKPLESDRAEDPTLGRAIHLRRAAGPSRVTIFEGGHEGIAVAALDWLGKHAKKPGK
jgi:dipeptidyl aminopeptidase/acylaminoacyl peptidase